MSVSHSALRQPLLDFWSEQLKDETGISYSDFQDFLRTMAYF